MYLNSKKDVDKHVEECMKRINNETQRNLRCLSFAKQYFKIDRYDDARRYLSTYLSVRPNAHEAHSLLGNIYEKLGKKDAAIQAYSTSLRLYSKQDNLVIKVCELLASDDVEMDQSGAKYFCALAQSVDPTNPALFNLKQRIITSVKDNPSEVSALFIAELEARPTDVKLRTKLLKHLLQNDQIKEAYKHVHDIQTKNHEIFRSNLAWYETVAEVLLKYQKIVAESALNWEFWFLSVGTLDRIVSLSLAENLVKSIKPTNEYVNTIFNFDQTLLKASLNIDDCPDKQLSKEFLEHYKAQICFHLFVLLLKQAQKDELRYKDVLNMSLPLLFHAYHTQAPDLQSVWFNHAPEERRNLMRIWRREAAFRCSQVGHILFSQAKERKAFLLEKTSQFSMGHWREQIYGKLFVTRDQKLKMKTSFFLINQKLVDVTIQMPDISELNLYDQEAQLLHPDSLHHQIWICLNNPSYKSSVFVGLQLTVKNLKNCGAETLNLLDIESFIYCATICAKSNLDSIKSTNYYNNDKPDLLPADITQELCTLNQAKFYKAAYKMYNKHLDSSGDQMRIILVEGLKLMRCIDSGLNVKLLIQLAQTFTHRAKIATNQSEKDATEMRAELYWKQALILLEKLKSNQQVYYPPNNLFMLQTKDLSHPEIASLIETGKLFIGTQLMKRKEYERALRTFELLRDPYASFHQAEIYKIMADEQTSQNRANVTSEMRSQNITMLACARDCYYLTLDRLREPSVDQKHALNAVLGTEIEKIERLLSRIDPDCANRNECDGMSDENNAISSPDSVGDHYTTGLSLSYQNGSHLHHVINHSTPFRADLLRREARPSPERLDAQIRQLSTAKDTTLSHIQDHNKMMLESHRTLIDELRTFKDAVNNLTSTVEDLKTMKSSSEDLNEIKKSVQELKASIEELDSFKTVTDMMHEMKRDITELKREMATKPAQLTDEDIYGLANEYSDFGANLQQSVYNYANYPTRLPPNYPPPGLYPGLYQAMPYGYPMPFGNDVLPVPLPQQGPQIQAFNPSALLAGQNLNSPVSSNILFNKQVVPVGTSVNPKPAPINVVISNSDPLPLKATTSQPILSVTIPPQHLKGGSMVASSTAINPAHNYQIPLTVTSMSNSSPSVLSQPAPAITTHTLLSNVAPPLYSAVAEPKANLNISLGRHDGSLKLDTSTKSNTSTASLDEHDPCPDFKPIIPLPDEVPVQTGEENEEVLFCEHAKLFRFDKGEWKERGVGSLKILKDNASKKVRILMRRDQVHKICANHYLTQDMHLTVMKSNSRAWIWAAHDFADGSVMVEKFCVRFKNEEAAKKFRDVFETAKKGTETKVPEKVEEPKKTIAFSFNTQTNVKEDQKVEEPKKLGGFTFTTPPNFKATKEAAPIEVTNIVKPEVKESPFAAFSFGTPSTPKNLFTDFKPLVKESPKPEIKDNDDEEFVPTADFAPVVPLPELVELKTGEENCEIMYESRAKLLRFDKSSKEWKERGVGIVKLLKDQSTFRLLMRRDQVHKVCCNHQILATMDFKPIKNNPKALTWCAQDFSEGVLEGSTFAIRFKNEDVALDFLKAVQDAQAQISEFKQNQPDSTSNDQLKQTESSFSFGNTVSNKSTPGFGDKFKPVEGSWSCKACYTRNVSNASVCVACEGPRSDQEKKTEASVSFAPSGKSTTGFGDKFKPVEGSWSCKACYISNESKATVCVACESPRFDEVKKTESNVITFGTSNSAKSSTGFGDKFKPIEGSWSCKACYISNNANAALCVACETPRNESTSPKKDSKEQAGLKGIDLSTPGQKFTFGVPSPVATSATVPDTKASFAFGQVLNSNSSTFAFGNSTIKKEPANSSFSFKSASTIESEKNVKPNGQFVFGSPQKHDFEFTPRSPRTSTGANDEESDGSFIEEESDSVYFKPVVPLPDVVDVKTGEEDEEVLYCHRAKLFRLIGGEWKERGLGDVKILRKKDTNKLRVVMRREQVFKICLNHNLNEDVKYLPKGENAWIFCVPDFSEGEIANEQFCLRFKTNEIAQDFMKAVNKACQKGSVTETETDSNEVLFVSETTVSPQEEDEAKKLLLPAKFMSYRQLPDCTCEQCKKDDEYYKNGTVIKPSKIPVLSSTTTSKLLDSTPTTALNLNTSSSSSAFGTPTGDVLSFASPKLDSGADTLKSILAKPSLLTTPNLRIPSTITDSTPTQILPTTIPNSTLFGSTPTQAVSFNTSTTSIFATPTSKPFSFASLSTEANKSTTIFGGLSASQNVSKTGSLFGTMTTTETNKSIFGAKPATPIFGSGSTTTTGTATNAFGQSPFKTTGSIFGGTTSTASSGSIFGGTVPNFGANYIFGGKESTSSTPASDALAKLKEVSITPIFGGATEQSTADTTKNLKETDAPVLDCSTGLSFASLASTTVPEAFTSKQDDVENVDSTAPFAFLGAGAPVFGSAKPKGAAGDNEDSIKQDEEDYDPHYEPIVPLPDQIVVSTGEEDETVIFNERAKLFRYDNNTKEWKERGVGQMKLLHHPVNNTYRFLLRREQVHKVVLNQRIVSDLDLQPLSSSDKAWFWAGHNYADNSTELEKLAVRFKNCELASQFHNSVQEVLSKLKNNSAVPHSTADTSVLIPTTIQNYGAEDISGGDSSKEVDHYDEDDDDDEDDRSVMFMKRCTLSEEVNNQWQTVCMGDLQVYYDHDLYAARICINNDNGVLVSNTIIGINTVMQVDGINCIWRAVEWSEVEPKWRNLRATFSSTSAAEDFHCNYLEGLNYAQEFDVVDELPEAQEDEETEETS